MHLHRHDTKGGSDTSGSNFKKDFVERLNNCSQIVRTVSPHVQYLDVTV